MGRYLAGAGSALLLMTAGFFLWRAQADLGVTAMMPSPIALAEGPLALADLAGPPAADERTREQKRFGRYDRDKNGAVGREEYLLARRKAFAKFDTNGDGRLSFDEYAIKTTTKFAAADKDRSGSLNAPEFATTRVVRKAKPTPKCPPTLRLPPVEAESEEG